jgi:translation initiation factor 2B subunit (eIF-2B alpha/beta/delta family)
MGLFECLPAADVVLIGADAVFPHGLVNKLGTHALVQLARLHRVPAYSLCTSLKWLPQDAKTLFRIEDHPPCEVWPEAPEDLRVTNHYFDTTPLELLSGIVSESGISTPGQLSRVLLRRQLAPALRQGPT